MITRRSMKMTKITGKLNRLKQTFTRQSKVCLSPLEFSVSCYSAINSLNNELVEHSAMNTEMGWH
jgi:hypothetical protein